MDDKYFIDKFYIKDNRCGYRIYGKRLLNISEEEKQYLLNRFNDSDSINESLQRIYYKIEEKNKCPICGKPVLWLGKKKRLMLNTCSQKCGFKLRQQHNQEYWIKKEGVNNVFATKECVNKIKNTKLERYGDENYNNNEQTVKTCLEKYGVRNGGGSKETLEKIKKHMLNKYGETTPFKVPEIKEKIKNTCLEKYGETCASKSNEIKEKIKNTCLEKYNHSSYLQSDEYKKHKVEYIIKRRNTLKQHHKLVQSKSEAYIYNLLKHYFNDIICQYYSLNYPFYCDFYIPEIDTYIEYQGYYTHGGHPYDDNNIDDKIEFDRLIKLNNNHKTPGHNLYNTKINVWTIDDINKRNIAKENNLNYIEFWNYDEVKNWLNNYEKKY